MSCCICQLNKSPAITKDTSKLPHYLSRNHLQKLIGDALLLTHEDFILLV